MSRKFLIPPLTAVFLAAPAFVSVTTIGLSSSAVAETLKTIKYQRPAVKSSKSNSSERAVHSGKSNSNDRAVTFGRDKLKGTTKNSGHATEK